MYNKNNDFEAFYEEDDFFFGDDSYEDYEEIKNNFTEQEYKEDEDNDEREGREIGIDLGTTNSVISYIADDEKCKFIKVDNEILISSVIFFKSDGNICFGKKAKTCDKAMSLGAMVSNFKKYLKADSEKIKISIPIDKYKSEDGKSYYIIDTNVFIDQPNILSYFDDNDVIILPITVEQELEYRTSDVNTKYSAEKALEEIVKYRDRIIFAESDKSLLPEDFFKNFSENFNNANNDNKIVTISLKYKEHNPTLISSDNRLAKLKASFVGVRGISLKEFMLEKDNDDRPKFNEIELTGVQATSMFLTYLKQEAEKSLKQPVDKVVITVPATFNIVEIENTKRAALNAGFSKVHIEKEPTAAAIAYNIDADDESSTFIYDFGGGTFDISIIRSDGKGGFEICATAGNSKLGGEDLTDRIKEYVYDFLEDNYDLVMCSEEDSKLTKEHYLYNLKTIYWAAENCKIELSVIETTTIALIDIYINDCEQKSVFIDINRQQFESIIKPTINKTISEMNNALSRADMMISDIDNIIIAGGTSLIPCIQSQVEHYFGRKPLSDRNAATLIAEGAAIIANTMFGKKHLINIEPQIFDMTYEDFGVALESWNYGCIIPAGTMLPATAEKRYSLVEDYQSQLNIKIYSRKSENQNSVKTYDQGVEYIDEIIMSNIPPMQIDDVDVIVKFEITKQYELLTDVTLVKKDGTIIDKSNIHINRQSTM